MNSFLPEHFVERVDRLALGLEPRDAVSRLRPARLVDVVLDGPPERPALYRHGSGRYVLLFAEHVDTPVAVRLVPRDRRYVPRRLEFAIPDLQAVLTAEGAGADVPTMSRVWGPILYPGAAYDVVDTQTCVRGRVTRGGHPVRWTRVEATADGHVIGRAHGDDRGEFLLVLGQNTDAVGDLTPTLAVTIDVFARDPALAVDPADPLGDLPLETAAAAGAPVDDVSTGVALPDHYVLVAHLPDHPLTLGRLTSVPIPV
jgi:hypothetical protein